ncbi:MAG TPA: condensation domain-containing protein, partial [Thermoanaerobaculia bacterium]|nr:condensation domain-containing protein [Thermoanaerobaculia bacterium]
GAGHPWQPDAAVRRHRSLVPRFGAKDVWTLFHSYAFDFSVWEIWGALLYGGRLVVVPYWVSRSPEAFYELLRDERVTVLNQTPSAFRQLIQAEEGDLALRYVIFGGEALEPAGLAPWFERHGDERPRLINMYGITETTVHVTYRPVGKADKVSAVGRPIPDLGVYLLDPALNLVPAGVPGEIFVGGAGLALGYLNRPELTAERFVPNPFGEPGSRLYRSGDLARRLPDGDLEYLGRIDHQVKIRGFRIELGEIESALARHPAVREAVALVREDRLVAWVVPAEGAAPTLSELRAFAGASLPDYMLPSALVVLDRLPLTPNGKADRRALAGMALETDPATQDYVPPRNGTEELLAVLWAEVLGVERAGVHDDFFALGGHSLLAVRLISKIEDAFGVRLSVRVVFQAKTLGEMAERIAKEKAGGAPLKAGAIGRVPRNGAPLPLSFSQERLWFLDQLAPGNAAYNVPSFVRLRGRLDETALRRTLAGVTRRHEALRTTFGESGGLPFQVIAPAREIALPLADLSALRGGAWEGEMLRLATEEARRPFDLVRGPLFRAGLVRLDGRDHVLLLNIHHIVSDGWSMGVLIREIAELYAALAEGRPPSLPELPIQYADYAAWQRDRLQGETLEAELAFWRQRLAGVPPLEMPTDRPRQLQPTFQGGLLSLDLPADLPDLLRALRRGEEVTSYMALLAAFQTLLLRYTGQTDFAVGSPVANRTQSELEGLVGFFVNTLPLRVDLSGGPTFRELLRRVREVTVAAFSHEEMPFERIVEELDPQREVGRNPVFQVMLALQSQPWPDLTMGGLDVSAIEAGTGGAKVDLTLAWREKAGRLLGFLEYSSDLFDAATAERMGRHAVTLLRGALEAPDRTLWELPMLSEQERHQLVATWNAAPREALGTEVLHERFAAQAIRSPEAVAVVCEGERLTYGELDRRANRIANHLIGLGVLPGDRVGLRLERSLEMVAAILGVLKAGAAYVPLDSTYPAERLAFMIEDSGVEILL